MDPLYVVGAILLSSTTNIFGGFYNRACKGAKSSSQFYNCIQLICVCFCWGIAFLIDRNFNVAVLPYSLGFSAGYCVAVFGVINALRTGPVMLTTLLTQMSLVVVSVWGFIFWSAPVTPFVIIGLVLTVIAVFLCLYTGKPKADASNRVKITPKWIMFALMAFGGNSICSIFQRTQQMVFCDENGKGQFAAQLMFFATLIGAVAFLIIYLCSDRSDQRVFAKKAYIPMIAGVGNMIMNVLVILLATSSLPSTMVYLPMTIFPLIIVSLFSFIVFKERMRVSQWIGVGSGIISALLLSL